MAAARDQAARILRAEPDTAEGEARARRFRGSRRAASRPARGRDRRAPPCRDAGPAGDPNSRPLRRPLLPIRPRRNPASARLVLMGIGALLALAAAAYGVHYFLVGRFFVSHRRRLCARQQHHARRAGVRPRRRDPSRRQRAGACRRRDLQDRRRRLPDRGRCRAHQDRDPAGHHRSHRPPGHRAGKRGRAGQRAAGVRRSRPEARRARLRSSAGAERQGIRLARHFRSVRSRARPGRGGGEVGAGGL